MESALEIHRENLRFSLAHLLESLDGLQHIELEAVTIHEVSLRYRRLAICSLLLDADTTGFSRLLSSSAQSYLSLLRKVEWHAIQSPYYLCASRAFPFLDALAAGEPDTAADIASHSAATWMRGDEYEDDFLYMRFLMDLAVDRHPARLTDGLRRLRAVASEREPERLGICEALLATDSTAFGTAMEHLELKRSEELAIQRKNPGAAPQMLATEPFVFIEGLALVRLAASQGIKPLHQYPGIPALTLTMPRRERSDALQWRTLT